MYKKPNWAKDGADWPNRDFSQFVEAGGLRWHVQIMGPLQTMDPVQPMGPSIVLLHGTGAATHSWAALMPILAKSHRVIAMDLPGHGFTATPNGYGLSLPGMSKLVLALLAKLKVDPIAIVGHSAGAAIGAEMILSGQITPKHLIALNGAFKPFDGLAAHVFPVIAKLIALNPVTIMALSRNGSDRARVEKLLAGTGSKLASETISHYTRLFGAPGHVNGVMGMMARWELGKLVPRMPLLGVPLTLIVGTGDKTIAPQVSRDVAKLVPGAQVLEVKGLGHLAHEEDAQAVATLIERLLEHRENSNL
jgi:magnesium chelatase accessory protein